MGHRYAIIGSGRQGTAAAYDLSKFGGADEIVMADLSLAQARAAAERVNRLLGRQVAKPVIADVKQPSSVRQTIEGADVLLSGVPYFFNRELSRLAAEAGVSMVDFGGNTDIVKQQLAMDRAFREAKSTLIPDCGMGPGFNITLAVYAMELLDVARHVQIYEGGLPAEPKAPWDYELTFNIEGLTNEYHGMATFLREGRLAHVRPFTGLEEVDFPPVGKLEAVVTTGALSTAPWSFQGTLTTFENKTLRYPGHWAKIAAFSELGLFDLEPVQVGTNRVVPREVFHALFEPKVTPKEIRDVCLERVVARGEKDGAPARAVVELVDHYDPQTGFTAMERMTGWHASIVASMIADGTIPPGAHPVERGVPAKAFVHEARRRGFDIVERIGPDRIPVEIPAV